MLITRLFAILYLLCVLMLGVFSSESPASPTDSKVAKKCDEPCFESCSKDKDLTTCGAQCGCEEKANEMNIQLTKNERCYGQCRQNCSLEMFAPKPPGTNATGSSGDCFGDCSCICNRGCTESCKTSPFKAFCLSSCGCPNNQTVTNALLKKVNYSISYPKICILVSFRLIFI